MNTTRCIFVCALVVAVQGLIWATLQLREMHAGINVETKIMHKKSGMGLTGVIHDLRDHGQQDRAQNRRQTPFTEKPNVSKTSIRTRSPITTQAASNITRSPTVAAGASMSAGVLEEDINSVLARAKRFSASKNSESELEFLNWLDGWVIPRILTGICF